MRAIGPAADSLAGMVRRYVKAFQAITSTDIKDAFLESGINVSRKRARNS